MPMSNLVIQPHRDIARFLVVIRVGLLRLVSLQSLVQGSSVRGRDGICRDVFTGGWGVDVASPANDELFVGSGQRANARNHGCVALLTRQRPDAGNSGWMGSIVESRRGGAGGCAG